MKYIIIAAVLLGSCNGQPKNVPQMLDTSYIDYVHRCVVFRHSDGSGNAIQLPDSFFFPDSSSGSNEAGQDGTSYSLPIVTRYKWRNMPYGGEIDKKTGKVTLKREPWHYFDEDGHLHTEPDTTNPAK